MYCNYCSNWSTFHTTFSHIPKRVRGEDQFKKQYQHLKSQMYLIEGHQQEKSEKRTVSRVRREIAKLKRKRDDGTNDEHRPKKQQMITEHFPLRRSMRQTKSTVEKEKFDVLAQKLRNKDEEGIEKFAAEGKGWGVRSTRLFRKGELICEYSGELITAEEAKDREAQYALAPETGCYMYYFEYMGRKMCVDATADNKRHGRLLNHSKSNPNVVTKLVVLDHLPYLCLMAGRDICQGEQLEYDYGDRSRLSIESHPWLVK